MLSSILTLQTGQPWFGNDMTNNLSGTTELADRGDFIGNTRDFKSGNSSIPYCSGSDFSTAGTIACTQLLGASSTVLTLSPAQTTAAANACFKAANAINAATVASLNSFGCYFQGHSVYIPGRDDLLQESTARTWG